MSLDAIGIACKDIKKSIEFYQLLGLNFKEFGEEHFEGTAPNGMRIMLDSYDLMKKINPNWKQPQTPGITLCFKQSSPEEVNQLFKKVTEAGFSTVKEPWDAFWDQRYSTVLDPNGTSIDIFSPLS